MSTRTQRPPGYELFFAPLQVSLDPSDYEQVQFAYFASKYGHAGQVRDGGERYFDHPKATAWIYISEFGGRDIRMIVDCLLHDLSEDTYLLSPYRIALNFGQDIALDVRALTKLPKGKETTECYLSRVIAQGPWAIAAKLTDRLHNLRTLSTCAKEKQGKQIEETHQYHIPMLIPALHAHNEIWGRYANLLDLEIEKAIRELKD
jgi:(p)ppGpp synthase/HD superfamily hydrolase